MRAWWIVALAVAGCGESAFPAPRDSTDFAARATPVLEDRVVDFAFAGGQLEFDLVRSGTRVTQFARNRYATPIMIQWSISGLDNLEPLTALDGVAFLPAAQAPNGAGEAIILAEFDQLEPSRRPWRELASRARFGDPRVRPRPYVYGLPYPVGRTFSVLQGFHGAFSHRGSNEYAVDFDCPVATQVLATRPGIVVATNARAEGAGMTSEFMEYKRTNFVLVQHDDGTLGEYMHLAPSGVEVRPGQRVERGQRLGLSGNTGFSSTPHLHFQVMTAGSDGASAQSFPFKFAVAPNRVEEPVQGRRYTAWETSRDRR